MVSEPDAVALVCSRVADRPTPVVPSYRDTCGRCGRRVWRSIRSVGLTLPVVCLVCALADSPPGTDWQAAPYVDADLER